MDKYCEIFIGHSSKIPVVRLLPRGVNRVCPLLKGDKCSVHDSKPVICASYPLGRVAVSDDMANGLHLSASKQMQYILTLVNCGRRKHKHTVRSWLEMFNIPIDDEFFFMWTDLIVSLSVTMRGYEEQGLSAKVLDMMWHSIVTALYAAYNTDKEFMEQFRENQNKITGLLKSFEEQFQPGKPTKPNQNE